MRAVAAAVVFVHHLPTPDGVSAGLWSDLTRHGGAGVTLFFALSGFVLMWSLRPSDRAPAFYRRRFARVYPALFVALLGGLAVSHHLGRAPDFEHALPAFLALQSWSSDPHYLFAVNQATWSLSCEAFFYLTFPLYAHRLRALSGRALGLLAVALLLVVAAAGVLAWQEPGRTTAWIVNQAPFLRVADFLLGALLAVAVASGRWRSVAVLPALALAGAVYVLGAFAPQALVDVARALVPALIVIGALAAADLAGRTTGLSNPAAIWAGEISYSFYLVHLPVIDLLDRHLSVPLVLACALPAAVTAAAALHYAVERPLERLIRGGNSVVVAGVDAPAARTAH